MSAVESNSVRVKRLLPASPERVFSAWVDATLLQQWLAPAAEADGRVGGHFRLEVSKPEGAHVVTGEYRELVPGRRLVMTWNYAGPLDPAGVAALLTVELRETASETEISLHHENLGNAGYSDAIKSGAWPKAFDQLEALLDHPKS